MLALAPGSATPGGYDALLPGESSRDGGDDTSGDLFANLADLASRLLEAELEDVAVRRRSGSRALEQASAPMLPPLGLTSFDRTAEEVHRWVTALGHPRRGAFGTVRRETVVIWSCEPAGSRAIGVPPGTILGADDGGVVVTTRAGSVRLLEVQVEGDGPEPATSWFSRRALPPGCAFEPVSWHSLDWMLR
jgi:methionyl-tRNA formyltransferase